MKQKDFKATDYEGKIEFHSSQEIHFIFIRDLEEKIENEISKQIALYGILSPLHNVKVTISPKEIPNFVETENLDEDILKDGFPTPEEEVRNTLMEIDLSNITSEYSNLSDEEKLKFLFNQNEKE